MKLFIRNLIIGLGILFGIINFVPILVQAATILFPSGGGTGTSTAPTYGQLLVGNSGGTYTLTATSSLGITSGGSGVGTSTNPFMATYFVATSTTATSTFAGGLTVNASQFVVATTSGNVGVGTLSPSFTLDVNGTLYSESITEGFRKAWGAGGGTSFIVHAPFVDGSQYDAGLKQNTDQRELNVFAKAADGISKITFSTGSTPSERMRITDAGNVGIGTTTPYVPLDVSGSMRIGGVNTCTFPSAGQGFEECYNSAAGTGLDGSSAGIALFQAFNRDNSTWKDVSIRGKEIDLELSGNQRMYLSATADSFYLNGGVPGMIINSTGVGFGAAPASPLDGQGTPNIDGAMRQVERLIDNTSFAKDVGADIAFWGKFSSGGAVGSFASVGGHKENATDGDYASYLNFITRVFGGSPTERMRITSTGNVGIGTTTPPGRLTILVAASTTPNLILDDTANGGCIINKDTTGGTYTEIYTQSGLILSKATTNITTCN